MDPEEAAMQLNMDQREFLAFRNSRTKEMNVIYRRRDGNLGLIEPAGRRVLKKSLWQVAQMLKRKAPERTRGVTVSVRRNDLPC